MAHCLLSTWHWSSVQPTPPPTSLHSNQHGDQVQWLSLDQEGSREDLWTEAYACCLLRACGRSSNWAVLDDGGQRNGSTGQPPGASIFDGHREAWVSPHTLHECWPPEHNIIPRQPMNETQALITQHLDEDAM